MPVKQTSLTCYDHKLYCRYLSALSLKASCDLTDSHCLIITISLKLKNCTLPEIKYCHPHDALHVDVLFLGFDVQ